MTLIFERDLGDGVPVTHAFVVGVGAYPDAKPGKGVNKDLRAVPDVASAADSAKRMCDWLIENKDKLGAPLATLEVLIGDAAHPAGATPYAWANAPAAAVQPPTVENVKARGKAWVGRLKARPGDTALFYGCGHGARWGADPVLFLQDLNTNEDDPWGGFFNVGETASAFKQLDEIRSAFFFLDACQEFSPKLELSKTSWFARIIKAQDPFLPSREKVFMLSATAAGMKTYDGVSDDVPGVRLGRFTQTLCTALDGAAVRYERGQWIVHPGPLYQDIKLLYGTYDWGDGDDPLPFDPTQTALPNEVHAIVRPDAPEVPVRVFTDPADKIAGFDLRIFANPNRGDPCVRSREARAATAWIAWVPASKYPHFAVADDGNGVFHQEMFNPDCPIFDQRIPIP
ncbi:MAG: caspase family protein [Phenylobacterium sp.]|uniref:caspase family protein n=1 Tax=Phenylobacterium sp. TaxID=1871053 RepID=UPI001A473B59|nr:caspase family protein [Phenylobacterium sp.]MBL8552931.1 caspase family protein [Phenylobacterium sp.]